jgi:hypothetical protein
MPRTDVAAVCSAAAAAWPVVPPTTEVQEAMGQLPSESELSWLGLNRRLGLSDGAALFSQLEQVREATAAGKGEAVQLLYTRGAA